MSALRWMDRRGPPAFLALSKRRAIMARMLGTRAIILQRLQNSHPAEAQRAVSKDAWRVRLARRPYSAPNF